MQPFGELVARRGAAGELQQAERLRFGQAAVKLGLVSESRVQEVLAEQYQYDVASPARQAAHHFELAIAAAPYSQEAEAIRQMVKDLRTEVETSDTQGVLDGDLDAFMGAALAQRVGETRGSSVD